MTLPNSFLGKFKRLMKTEEYNEFINSFEKHIFEGIRFNSLKLTKDEFLKRINNISERIPWTSDGFYFNKENSDVRITIHPYYHQGLFYIQEPSAMYPAELLAATREDKVLDLCAAPGGKTVQIAAQMENKSLLVSNEISPKRVRALKKNVELYGIKNTIITNSTGKNLLETYGTYFDKILVDAPCSGEGTFRKDKHAIKEYDKYVGQELYETQRDILDFAFKMLKNGGYLVYSTCTFNPEENEKQIEYLIKTYDCQLVEGNKTDGMASGRPLWSEESTIDLEKTTRFWPHMTKSEGHFIAKILKLSGEEYKGKNSKSKWKPYKYIPEKIREFMDNNIRIDFNNSFYYCEDEEYYLMDHEYPFDKKNKIQHLGMNIGKLNKYNFIPSQSFAMTLRQNEVKKIIEVDFNNANKYLKGETLEINQEDGYYGIVYQDNILGWAKFNNGFFKNLYEKSWRKVNDGNSFNTSIN
ncbi:MAG: NOL1/NOP2/sun family putative RNA methylase [Fusobacteria bacterium]|nr:MAG: NOL1/NOP2/sun family putative RNA methylase [Fusobacteriota bacterium]KAF0229805.1 MAG: NOL1/NOP2/sun family putative RNA [Fusobacteriota bacterium]